MTTEQETLLSVPIILAELDGMRAAASHIAKRIRDEVRESAAAPT